jgi:hypothetical protein
MALALILKQSYVDDIRRAEQLSIYEQKDVELMNMQPGESNFFLQDRNLDFN